MISATLEKIVPASVPICAAFVPTAASVVILAFAPNDQSTTPFSKLGFSGGSQLSTIAILGTVVNSTAKLELIRTSIFSSACSKKLLIFVSVLFAVSLFGKLKRVHKTTIM